MFNVVKDTDKEHVQRSTESPDKPQCQEIVPAAVEGLAITIRLRHGDNLPHSVTVERLYEAARKAIQQFFQEGNLVRVSSWTSLFNDIFDAWRGNFDTRSYDVVISHHEPKSVVIESLKNVDRVYHLYGSLNEGGQVREALDTLIDNPDLDQRVAYAVRQVVDELRANKQVKHTTRYEYVLMVLLLQPNEPIPIKYLSKFFEGSPNPDQAVRNLLGRLNEKLEAHRVAVQHSSAYQLLPTG